jgi:hypothetical protein
MYNSTGVQVVHKQLPVLAAPTTTTSVLPLPHLQPGMYLLRLSNGKEVSTAKFILTH